MRQVRQYKAIREEHKEKAYPIEPMCDILHVARSAYYKWASGKKSCREVENRKLAEKIEQIHEESSDKGYRRINDDLKQDHIIHVNDKRVLRICCTRSIKDTPHK